MQYSVLNWAPTCVVGQVTGAWEKFSRTENTALQYFHTYGVNSPDKNIKFSKASTMCILWQRNQMKVSFLNSCLFVEFGFTLKRSSVSFLMQFYDKLKIHFTCLMQLSLNFSALCEILATLIISWTDRHVGCLTH